MTRKSELAAYLARAGWTPQRLAHEINHAYGRWTISEKAPYGWLRGSYPRGRVPGMVAELLSRRLGEAVAVTDVWPVVSSPGARVGARDGAERSPWHEDGFWRFVGGGLDDDAGCSPRHPVQAAVDWVFAPAAPAPSRSRGRSLDPAALDVARAGATQLWDLYWSRGRSPNLDTVQQDLARVSTLLFEYAYGPDEAADMLVTLSRLANLAGAVAWDHGRRDLGLHYLVAALRASHLGGAHDLGAYVLSWLSYFLLWDERHDDALRVAQLGRRGSAAVDLPPSVAGLLDVYRVRALALTGATGELHRVVDGIDVENAGVARPEDPQWCRWLGAGTLEGHIGRAWLDAGRPDRAVASLTRGLGTFAVEHPRGRALHELSLASAHLRGGDEDAALTCLASTLERVDCLDNRRARIRLSTIRGALAERGAGPGDEVVVGIDALTRAEPSRPDRRAPALTTS